MKTIVIYASQTGFTKKYADWISKRINADQLSIDQAKKKKADYFDEYDTVIFGGWAMAGSMVQSKWFLEKAVSWKNKKLAMYLVGASPAESPEIDSALKKLLTDEQRKYIKAFYCQGGLNYDTMKLPSKLAMKALASTLKKKKDATDDEKLMAEMISHSYDISDEKYIEPIIEYVGE